MRHPYKQVERCRLAALSGEALSLSEFLLGGKEKKKGCRGERF